jgi:hypothetical protein
MQHGFSAFGSSDGRGDGELPSINSVNALRYAVLRLLQLLEPGVRIPGNAFFSPIPMHHYDYDDQNEDYN